MNTYKICLIGDAQVGKSTLLHRFANGHFNNNYEPTLGIEVDPIRHMNSCLNVWDCGGQYQGLGDGYYVQADGAIVMFDLTNKQSFENVGNWIISFLRVVGDKPIVICGSKYDVKEKQVLTGDIQQFLFYDLPKLVQKHNLVLTNVKYYDVSSKSNYNFDKPFSWLI